MKVAILSESSADEAALRILADAALGVETILPDPLSLKSRGWGSVPKVLSAVVQHLHYQTDCLGLVVVVDSNGSLLHENGHEATPNADCRLCTLRGIRQQALSALTVVPGRTTLRVAIGIAIPSIEAWLLCGVDAGVNEAQWRNGRLQGNAPYDALGLKRRVYGSERSSLAQQTQRMREEATRLAGVLTRLETEFPTGFGALINDLRSWKNP